MGVLGGYLYWKVVLEFWFGHPKCHCRYPQNVENGSFWVFLAKVVTPFLDIKIGNKVNLSIIERGGSPAFRKFTVCCYLALVERLLDQWVILKDFLQNRCISVSPWSREILLRSLMIWIEGVIWCWLIRLIYHACNLGCLFFQML